MPSPTKIIRLSAENVKRLRAVEIKPDGALVTIRGKNGAGKSSVLDAIWMALGGRRAFPRKPVREGAKEASIELDLGAIIVTRKIKPTGQTSLVVASKDGARHPSPQALLDTLVAGLSFDPLAFARMKAAEQREVLRELVGLDTTAIEQERAELYNERTTVNREVKRLGAEVSGVTHHADAPAEEVSVAELSKTLQAAEGHQRQVDGAERDVERAVGELERADEHGETLRAEAEALEQKLAELRGRLDKGTKTVVPKIERDLDDARRRLDTLRNSAPDREAIREQLATAEQLNAQVRDNRRREEIAAKHRTADGKAKGLTDAIAACDEKKGDLIAAAKFPLDGLGVDDEGVLLGGLPFEQASSAEQLRASVAIGLALNPTLRVLLVRDGSLLDEDSLELLGTMASEADAQVWVEMVSEGDGDVGIVIEDGAVKDAIAGAGS